MIKSADRLLGLFQDRFVKLRLRCLKFLDVTNCEHFHSGSELVLANHGLPCLHNQSGGQSRYDDPEHEFADREPFHDVVSARREFTPAL
jgi:hypothetical protein